MAKMIHSMIRVLEEERSVTFYTQAFGLEIADRLDFETFEVFTIRRITEPGHTDHSFLYPSLLAGSFGHTSHRDTHLPGYTQK